MKDRTSPGSCGTLEPAASNCPDWCRRDHSRGAPDLHTRAFLPPETLGRSVLVMSRCGNPPTINVLAAPGKDDALNLWDMNPVQAYALAGLVGNLGDDELSGRILSAVELIAPEVTA